MNAVETTVGVESGIGTATLVHAMPGRMRLRLDSVRGDADRAVAVEQALAKLDFVERVIARTVTGTVIVEYSPESAGAADVLEQVARALDVDIEERQPAPTVAPRRIDTEEVAAGIRDFVRGSNARVAAATGGLDLRVIVPGVLFCLGIGALLGSRRRQMPAWHTLIWYAYNTFDKLNRAPQDMEDFTQG